MSQSDYLRLKRTAAILKEPQKLPNILSNQDYVLFRSFREEMNTETDKYQYYHLYPPETRYVFDIVVDPHQATICNQLTTNYCALQRPPMLNVQFTPKQPGPLALKKYKLLFPCKSTTAYALSHIDHKANVCSDK
jgi:hypothetical protein